MWRPGRCGLLALSWLAATANARDADDTHRAISLQVSPLSSAAPARWRILIRVDVSGTDRVLSVFTANGLFRRPSAWTIGLAPSSSRTHYYVEWKDIPQGHYVVIAGIGDGQTWRAVAQVHAAVY